MRPHHKATRLAVPGPNVATANRGPDTRALAVQQEHVVGSGFDTELRSPAVTDGGETGLQPASDALHPWYEDPRAGALELLLRNEGGGRFRSERGRGDLALEWIRPGRNQRHGIDRRTERLGGWLGYL